MPVRGAGTGPRLAAWTAEGLRRMGAIDPDGLAAALKIDGEDK
jgi:hypothetical protein